MDENYKPLVLEKIEEYSRCIPEYSFCDILFSIVAQYERSTGRKFDKADLLGDATTDQNIYKYTSDALLKEQQRLGKVRQRALSKPKYNFQNNVDVLYSSDLGYWNTTLAMIKVVQDSFDRNSRLKFEYIVTKQQTNE